MYPQNGFFMNLETLNPELGIKKYYQIEAGRDLFSEWFVTFTRAAQNRSQNKTYSKKSKEHLIFAVMSSLNRYLQTVGTSLKVRKFTANRNGKTCLNRFYYY